MAITTTALTSTTGISIDNSYVLSTDTFEIWRQKTNRLYTDLVKVNSDGAGSLAVTADIASATSGLTNFVKLSADNQTIAGTKTFTSGLTSTSGILIKYGPNDTHFDTLSAYSDQLNTLTCTNFRITQNLTVVGNTTTTTGTLTAGAITATSIVLGGTDIVTRIAAAVTAAAINLSDITVGTSPNIATLSLKTDQTVFRINGHGVRQSSSPDWLGLGPNWTGNPGITAGYTMINKLQVTEWLNVGENSSNSNSNNTGVINSGAIFANGIRVFSNASGSIGRSFFPAAGSITAEKLIANSMSTDVLAISFNLKTLYPNSYSLSEFNSRTLTGLIQSTSVPAPDLGRIYFTQVGGNLLFGTDPNSKSTDADYNNEHDYLVSHDKSYSVDNRAKIAIGASNISLIQKTQYNALRVDPYAEIITNAYVNLYTTLGAELSSYTATIRSDHSYKINSAASLVERLIATLTTAIPQFNDISNGIYNVLIATELANLRKFAAYFLEHSTINLLTTERNRIFTQALTSGTAAAGSVSAVLAILTTISGGTSGTPGPTYVVSAGPIPNADAIKSTLASACLATAIAFVEEKLVETIHEEILMPYIVVVKTPILPLLPTTNPNRKRRRMNIRIPGDIIKRYGSGILGGVIEFTNMVTGEIYDRIRYHITSDTAIRFNFETIGEIVANEQNPYIGISTTETTEYGVFTAIGSDIDSIRVQNIDTDNVNKFYITSLIKRPQSMNVQTAVANVKYTPALKTYVYLVNSISNANALISDIFNVASLKRYISTAQNAAEATLGTSPAGMVASNMMFSLVMISNVLLNTDAAYSPITTSYNSADLSASGTPVVANNITGKQIASAKGDPGFKDLSLIFTLNETLLNILNIEGVIIALNKNTSYYATGIQTDDRAISIAKAIVEVIRDPVLPDSATVSMNSQTLSHSCVYEVIRGSGCKIQVTSLAIAAITRSVTTNQSVPGTTLSFTNITGIFVGMIVTGSRIATGTTVTVTAVTSNSITLSTATTLVVTTATGAITFTGRYQIATAKIINGGSGYAQGDILQLGSAVETLPYYGTNTLAAFSVATVGTTGNVLSITFAQYGNYRDTIVGTFDTINSSMARLAITWETIDNVSKVSRFAIANAGTKYQVDDVLVVQGGTLNTSSLPLTYTVNKLSTTSLAEITEQLPKALYTTIPSNGYYENLDATPQVPWNVLDTKTYRGKMVAFDKGSTPDLNSVLAYVSAVRAQTAINAWASVMPLLSSIVKKNAGTSIKYDFKFTGKFIYAGCGDYHHYNNIQLYRLKHATTVTPATITAVSTTTAGSLVRWPTGSVVIAPAAGSLVRWSWQSHGNFADATNFNNYAYNTYNVSLAKDKDLLEAGEYTYFFYTWNGVHPSSFQYLAGPDECYFNLTEE